MVFWGAEVEPGKPFIHRGESDEEYEGSRLHLSQATLGLDGQGKKRTVVKCKVGDGPEHLLCSLTPGVSESCSLDLLFDQDVVFSVTGSTSVHLVGYYMPLEDEGEDDDYAYDEEDSDEDDDDFIDDEEDSELDVPPTSVTIEEIEDELPETPRLLQIEEKKQFLLQEIPVKESKKAAKKRQKAEAAAAATAVSGAAAPSNSGEGLEESEDEDGFPLPPKKKQAMNGSDDTPSPLTASKKSKKKKKNKKETADKAVVQTEKSVSVEETVKEAGKENGSKEGVTKKAVGGNGAVATPVAETKVKSAKKASANRKFPNGLEIEETAMGKPDARQAMMGKKVSVYYSGKLKANGKIFDSNIGKKPFSFRLGVGEVIKGWDVGVQGMRIGDKRRITVPPAMAYGPKGVSGAIPGNSWLVFDVEMTDVAK